MPVVASRPAGGILFFGVALGCGFPDPTDPTAAGTSGSTGGSTAAESSGEELPVPTTTEELTTDASSTAPASDLCGNGVVEPPETCDDGNHDGNDGCEPGCTLTPPVALLWQRSLSVLAWTEIRDIEISATGDTVFGGMAAVYHSLDGQRITGGLSAQGDSLWEDVQNGPVPDGFTDYGETFGSLETLPSGAVVTCGSEYIGGGALSWVSMYGGDGVMLWEVEGEAPLPKNYSYCGAASTMSHGIFAVGSDEGSGWMAHFGIDGNLEWKKGLPKGVPFYDILVVDAHPGETVIIPSDSGIHQFTTDGEYLGAFEEAENWTLLGRTASGFAAIRTQEGSQRFSVVEVTDSQLLISSEFEFQGGDNELGAATDDSGNAYFVTSSTISKFTSSGVMQWTTAHPKPIEDLKNHRVDVNPVGTRMVIAGDRSFGDEQEIYIQQFSLSP